MVVDDTLSMRIYSFIDNILINKTIKQIKQKIDFIVFCVRHLELIVTAVTINGFTPVNMDIQMIGGPYGVAYYVCSYICKSEPDTLKNALSTLLQQMSTSDSISLRTRMFRIGLCVLKHRTLSAQEAAYRICGLQLTWSTRETIPVCALPPHKQYRKLKSLSERQSLPRNSTDIFEHNNLDSYYERPLCLENVSLFRFLQTYRVSAALQIHCVY